MANQHRYRSEIQRICEKGHWTADQIHKELKKTYFFIGIGTVYRTLQAMVDEKVLMKTPGVIDKILYETHKSAHGHLHCHKTGWILDVDIQNLPVQTVPFPDGFTLEEVNMIFNGAFYNTGDDCDGEVVVKK